MKYSEYNEALIGKAIGIKPGDELVASDGSVRVKVIREVRERIWVNIIGKDTPRGRSSLRSVTALHLVQYRQSGKDMYDLWTIGGKTLKSLYESAITKSNPPKKEKDLCRSDWFKETRDDGNLYLLDRCLEFIQSFCATYKGPVQDGDFFRPVARMMNREKLNAIFFKCADDSVREELRRYEYGRIGEPDFESPENLLMALWLHPRSNGRLRRELNVWLSAAREVLKGWLAEIPDPIAARLEELGKLMSLDDPQLRLVALAAAYALNVMPSNDLCGEIKIEKVRLMASLLGLSEADYLDLVGTDSKLLRFGCLDRDGDLEDSLLSYLRGISTDPLSSKYFVRCEEETLPWGYFGRLAETHGEMMKRLVATGSECGRNVLLYGEPGTGKTSFAMALAAELGRTAYMIPHGDDKMKSSGRTFRFAALQVCDGQVNPETSLIIIDEADEMLENAESGLFSILSFRGSEKGGKGLLNDVMDKVRTPCIWIANSKARQLDPSSRRRFDYSVKFDKLTRVQREAIWRNAADRHGVKFQEDVLSDLATRYEVSAGGISQAVANLAAMDVSETDEAVEILERLLVPHSELLEIASSRGRAAPPDGYSLDGLNVSGAVSPAKLLDAVGKYLRDRDESLRSKANRQPMSMLFSGPPGTGKTELVKHMGRVLDRRVLTRLGGDLLDKFVGGTEERIRQAFAEAETDDAILFLDEVDGMLQSREHASRSWEVTQVNELLHRMENFEGVLVAATNFVQSLDRAVLRRFTFKLEFGYLTDEGKRLLFERVFASFGDMHMNPEQEARLLRIPDLSPGDFRTVRQGLIFVDGAVTVPTLLEELERESALKRQGTAMRVGFA